MRISDWSSDVCSSDLRGRGGLRRALFLYAVGPRGRGAGARRGRRRRARRDDGPGLRKDRKSVVEGKSVSVRVDLGGRRIIKKKKHTKATIATVISRAHTCANT